MIPNAKARLFAAIVLYLLFFATPSFAQVSTELAQKAKGASELAAIAAQNGYVRVIVQFPAPVPAARIRPDAQALAPVKAQIASSQAAIITSHFGSVTDPQQGSGFSRDLVRFDVSPMFAVNVSLDELNALAADPRVTLIHLDRALPPTLNQSVPIIGMPAAYAANATGLRQAVAIVDTGVQSNHEFLRDNLVTQEACFSSTNAAANPVSLCPNLQTSEIGPQAANTTTGRCINGSSSLCEHGSHVAGIAAGDNANPGGGNPPNGVARSGRIVAVQVFSRFNTDTDCAFGPPCVLSVISDQIRGLEWIFQNALVPETGVRLAAVNMSLGGGRFTDACDDQPQKPVIDLLRSAGVATVIAAGNDGFTDAIGSPACISTAVAIGSVDKQDVISSFSNMSAQVKLMAPGGLGFLPDGTPPPCVPGTDNANILSSVSATSSATTNLYDCMPGTSQATPHVTGAFAALRTVCPDATIDRIVAALQQTGVPIADTRPGGTLTVPRISVDLARQVLGCASHDLNGDGKSDIVWRDTAGNIAVWLMNGAQVSSSGAIGAVPPVWSIVGQRDFDGDGKYDLLWRDANGDTAIWLMDGVQVLSSGAVGNVPATWSVVGTGDFSGTGRGGILWRDAAGDTAIWLMDGTQIEAEGSLGNVPTTWSVAGTGDFDGDGLCDILWRDSAGNVSIWFMNGTEVAGEGSVGNVPSVWSVVGTGDFDGDGRTDIVWRDTSGDVSIWFMNGSNVVSTSGLGTVPTAFVLVQTGDYDGDGLSDLLWRGSAGDTSIWFMDGGQVASMQAVGSVPTTWTVQGANAD